MRKILLIAGFLVIGLGIVAYLIYNKPHQNMQKAEADMKVNAEELFSAFASDETAANEKYLDKVLAVTGEVKSVNTSEEGTVTITLNAGSEMFGVTCELDALSEHAKTDFQPGETITVKGICTGMLMDVVLVRCVVV